VRPADVVKCLVRKQKEERYQKALPFAYWAKIIEEWVVQHRHERAGHTPTMPRTAARRPGVVIEMGDITNLLPCEYLYRQLANPNLYVDIPPRYLSPLPPVEEDDDEEWGGDLNPTEVAEVVALLGEL
jgi:hypothetical protein